MKVVVVINTAWNIANFRLGLLRALRDAGHEVVAMAPPDAYVPVIEQAGFRFVPLQMDNQGTNPLRDLALFFRFLCVLRREKPNLFLGYTIKPNVYGSLAAQRLGISVVNNVAGLGTAFLSGSWLSRLILLLYRTAFKKSARVFFQNATDRQLFIDHGIVDSARTDLLPGSGVDLQHFAFAPIPESSKEFVFLMVARLLGDKGINEYVEAARGVRARHDERQCTVLIQKELTPRFLLVGEADAKNPTAITREQAEAWHREGVIEYLGKVDDVRPLLANAHCVVLPSYREGLSRALLEAAALGRPLIATDVPGCQEVVDDGVNGYLCQPRNAEDLSEQMLKIMQRTEAELAAMGAASRAKVEVEYSEEIVIRKYLDAIEEIRQSKNIQ